jgi:hypothetical protein
MDICGPLLMQRRLGIVVPLTFFYVSTEFIQLVLPRKTPQWIGWMIAAGPFNKRSRSVEVLRIHKSSDSHHVEIGRRLDFNCFSQMSERLIEVSFIPR